MEKEKVSKMYGAIRLQTVVRQVGSWKYANSRGYYRIIRSPYMNRPEINIMRPGETIVWESGRLQTVNVTFDYWGGDWGFGSALDKAIKVFENTYFTK